MAVVHHRAALGPDWVLGEPVNFSVSMNIYSDDGSLVAGDVGVPDLAAGQDEQGVFFVDYGERGRAGGGAEAQLWRAAVE